MMEEEQRRQKKRKRIWLAVSAVAVLLVVFIVPPFLSISRYKSRITSLMAESLGRPVRLSSVQLRLLPRPGFVFYDLVVDEDQAFGAEPLLHASSVTASIRLLSLWRGRLELSSVSVDEASLNLVRSRDGYWNLDSLLRTAATKADAAQDRATHAPPFPSIAATNSRVNFKNGVEKLPFSLVDTDLSVSQSEPGVWHLRLRGQPVRTDVSLAQADTGIVELSVVAHKTPDIHQMPIRLDLNWHDAQLGQLTRLATGSDAGWRGFLRGEVHLEGTAESATVKTRLRATDVHRAEFAPVVPMDFDANCGLVYHYSARSLENLVCDSPLGNGHIRLTGDLPGKTGQQHLSVELDKIPVAAGLDALRTVRSGVDPDLAATGTASGKIVYDESPAPAPASNAKAVRSHAAKTPPAEGPLSGSFTLENFKLSGGGISRPIQVPKVVFAPAPVAQGQPSALVAAATVPLGGAVPLTVNVRLELPGYQVGMRGQVSVAQGRELARAVGIRQATELNGLAGDPLAVDLTAAGPWLPAAEVSLEGAPPVAAVASVPVRGKSAQAKSAALKQDTAFVIPAADSLSGTVTMHGANWNADYLANHVQISDATLHVNLLGGAGDIQWAPVNFSYGPLKGVASFNLPVACNTPEPCPIHFQMHFGELDSVTLQAAILGAHQKGTLLSDLIAKLHPAAPPVWPSIEGTVEADSLVLGPATLKSVRADVRFKPNGVEITGLDARLLGGAMHVAGTLTSGDKPAYMFEGNFEKLNPVAVGQMLGEKWRGGTFDANGKIELTGYSGSDLADSAKGTLHFEWRRGMAGGRVPQQLARFDHWTGDAAIAGSKVALGQNEIVLGSRKQAVDASVTLSEPPRLTFGAPSQSAAPSPAHAAKGAAKRPPVQ
jgi:hypothetical protein